MKFKITNKGLLWGLIVTFGVLYLLVAFVSTLHAIDFFRLSNIGALAILLGVAYEVGQASVLFSILMTKNKEKFLPWLLMFLLTALQVTANVYASYKHMSISGNNDWTFWYTSILKIFGVAGGTTETYQVIISWISGALLPIVALGMTALVAQNIKLITEDGEVEETGEPVDASDIISEVSKVRPTEDELEMAEAVLSKKKPEGYFEKEIPLKQPRTQEEIDKIKKLMTKDPIESGAISDDLKKTLSPGLELDDDLYPDTDVRGEATENLPEPDGKDDGTSKKLMPEVVPALSEEEVREAFMDELEGKEPESISDILGVENTPTEEELSIINQDLMGELKEIVAQTDEVEAQIPPESEPETVPNEPQTEKSEYEKFVDNVLPVDEGFDDIEPKDMGEVLTDLAERVEPPPSPPPIEPSPEEQEEARLEHLRNIARENLKKK